jgi:hypothetical protein
MSYICKDCGTDTTPCTGQRSCRHKGRWEHYMVTGDVWGAAGMPASAVRAHGQSDGDFLCIGCLENRIGRLLCAQDFTDAPINDPDDPWATPRIRSRLQSGLGYRAAQVSFSC